MGPRPPDFNEEVLKQSPTYHRWEKLAPGEKLRYACREFTKGHGDDDERLMRRIMIARRNNLRDHELLKQARRKTKKPAAPPAANMTVTVSDVMVNMAAAFPPAGGVRKRGIPASQQQKLKDMSVSSKEDEMDIAAVEATRSYKTWLTLDDGEDFVYNQKYTKGKEGQDWLLKKNIWRRMRYRRENKRMVERLRQQGVLEGKEGDEGAASATGQDDDAMRNDMEDDDELSHLEGVTSGKGDDVLDGMDLSSPDLHHDLSPTSGTPSHHHHQHELDVHHQLNVSPLPVDVTSQSMTEAASAIASDRHNHHSSLDHDDDLTDADAIAAAVAAGETFGKSSHVDVVGDPNHQVMHNPLELDDAAATAAKLVEAGQFYGVDV
jgi:hypothetical protein